MQRSEALCIHASSLHALAKALGAAFYHTILTCRTKSVDVIFDLLSAGDKTCQQSLYVYREDKSLYAYKYDKSRCGIVHYTNINKIKI